jgi:hypothetical protein
MSILEPSEQAKTAIGKRVTVLDHPDGRLSMGSFAAGQQADDMLTESRSLEPAVVRVARSHGLAFRP